MAALRPNVVLITLHDLGRHLRCYDPDLPTTPNIMRIAEQGVVFENHFSTCPLCSPARASIQTGRYPHTNGMDGLTHRGFGLGANEKCMPMHFNELGYHTALYGFQHEIRGDAAKLGYVEVRAGKGYSTHWPEVVPGAVAFLRRKHEKPFLLSIGSFEVHRDFRQPYSTPTDPAAVKVPPYLPDYLEVRQDLAAFYGLVQVVDRGIVDLLDALDATGLTDNTLLIFTTDHGAAFPRAKSTLYDAGIGVTLLARWPGAIRPGSRISAMTSHLDILPTLLEIAGGEIDERIQGKSFAHLLADPTGPGDDTVFAEKSWHGNEYDPMRCIRTDRYKFIMNFQNGFLYQIPLDIKQGASGRAADPLRCRPRPDTELYDLAADPDEMDNLSGRSEVAAIETTLKQRLLSRMKDTGDPLPERHVPWPQPDKPHYLNNMDAPMPETPSDDPFPTR